MHQFKTDDFPIGTKVFARYTDEFNDVQINFIPTYVVEEQNSLYIGTKNNMVGTQKGYFQLEALTGTDQINSNFLSNVYTKSKE